MYLYSFICLSAGAVQWESSFFAITIAPCTSKGDISASDICHLWMFVLFDWYIGHIAPSSSLASSCHFGGLSWSSHFNLLRHVHRQCKSLLSYCYHFHFVKDRECPCSRRQPTVPKLLLIIISV